MNINEEERRARLLKMRAERLPDIKKQFEMMTESREHWKTCAEEWKNKCSNNYDRFIEERTRADQEEESRKALKEEIITLKAKLYDLMTA